MSSPGTSHYNFRVPCSFSDQLYDSKCDGVLDFDEFSEGITMCQLDHLFPRSLQRTLFDKIDTNKVLLDCAATVHAFEEGTE